MSDIETRLHFHGDDLTVQRTQDVEDILENNKTLAKQPNPRGDRFWHKWSIPNVVVEKFYIEYNAGRQEALPMDEVFWDWVDKQVMSSPDYLHFRTANSSKPFFMGYKK